MKSTVSGTVTGKGNYCLLSTRNYTKHFMLSQFIEKVIIWDQKGKEATRNISITTSEDRI